MSLIKDSFPGRKDGSYTRLFGDQDFGSLISAVHSASIKAGCTLERLIASHSKLLDHTQLDMFFDMCLPAGVYLIPKDLLQNDDRLIDVQPPPDFLLVNTYQNKCLAVEIKLGDNFDTKKSTGEVYNLKRFIARLNKVTGYHNSIAVCMWFTKTRQAIVAGFKSKISENEALTGCEFSNLAKIDFEHINAHMFRQQEANREFFVETVLGLQR